jgi:hypothetical protein
VRGRKVGKEAREESEAAEKAGTGADVAETSTGTVTAGM